MLLLPRRILQGVLGRSPCLRRWRTTKRISRRKLIPVDHPKYSSLLFICRVGLYPFSGPRCLECHVVCGRFRSEALWNWSRLVSAYAECGLARRLLVWLPFAPAFDWRLPGRSLSVSGLCSLLRVCELLKSPPHVVGVDQPFLGRIHGSLHTFVLSRYLARLENLLNIGCRSRSLPPYCKLNTWPTTKLSNTKC